LKPSGKGGVNTGFRGVNQGQNNAKKACSVEQRGLERWDATEKDNLERGRGGEEANLNLQLHAAVGGGGRGKPNKQEARKREEEPWSENSSARGE